MTRIRLATMVLAALVLVAAAGCGGGAKGVVKVTGTLTFKGKPVNNAYVDFVPQDGQRPSWGMTDEQGRFTLEYDDKTKGAVTGKHKVFVRLRPVTVAEQEAVMMGRTPPMSPDMKTFFDKYGAEKSTIEIDIQKAVDLKLDWD